MTRSGLWFAVAAGLLLAAVRPAAAAEEKAVFIDLDRIFSEYYKTKIADDQLKDQADEFNAERRELVDQLKQMEEAFNAARDEAQNTALSEDVRNRRRTEAEEKLIELREHESKIRRFDESRRKQLEDQGRRMRKRIVEEIQKTIQDQAKSQGYVSVIDSSGQSLNGVPVILYTDPRMDITDDILEILNKGQEKTETTKSE